MNKLKQNSVVFFFMAVMSYTGYGQYTPKDGAKLSYNQIYFQFPSHINAINYKIILAYDSTQAKNDFNSFLIDTIIVRKNQANINALAYGRKYKWKVETILKTKTTVTSNIQHFSLYECPYADTSKYKFKQHYNQQTKIKEGILWLDQMHCAIDRKLNVVWFLPPIIDDFKEEKQIRDFRVYNDGTISFISEGDAFHITKDLQILWKAPNDGKVSGEIKENYHHHFEKLNNGNYLVLGNQFLELEKIDSKDTANQKIEFTTAIEYNPKKEIVWSWKMIEHFPLDLLADESNNGIFNTHCNSIALSQKGDKLLLGFRDISRVIEIDKKTGKIVRSFGKKLNNKDTLVFETKDFMYPHDSKYLKNDLQFGLINNNDVKNSKISGFDIYKFPKHRADKLKSVYSFKFNYDKYSSGMSAKLGNFIFLKNTQNILINEGATGRIIEIDEKNKEPLWDVELLKNYNPGGWKIFPVYRVHFSEKI